ncbi:saccharopine dehydrogenase family protein [Rhodococcus triatomae]|nr:hypothetical protein G419_05422 [Rhodococcus triatomae BKS 15-14]
MTTVLVLGGYGAVGTHLVSALRSAGVTALAAGRDPARADRVVDLSAPLDAALTGVDMVVNCAGLEDPVLAADVAGRGMPFVDVTATSAYASALESVSGPVLLGVGIAPGLSSVLAVEAARGGGPVDIAIGLGAGESHGAAATAWTYGLAGRTFRDPDGSRVRNYTRPTRFPLPGYSRFPVLRTDFADQHRLTADLGTPVRTHLRLDSRLATAGMAALTWTPWAARWVPAGAMPGGDMWEIAARGASRTVWASGHGQSIATALVAAEAVRLLQSTPIAKPTWLHQVTDLTALASALNPDAIRFG